MGGEEMDERIADHFDRVCGSLGEGLSDESERYGPLGSGRGHGVASDNSVDTPDRGVLRLMVIACPLSHGLSCRINASYPANHVS